MSNFYLYAALLIALSSLFVIIPLLIKAKSNRLQLSNANVVKQRIIELDREVEEGLISEKDKLSSVRDLKLALVEESDIASDKTISPTGKVNWLLVSLLALPAIGLGLWVYTSSNQLDGLQEFIDAQSDAASLSARIQGQSAAQVSPDDYAKFALVIRNRLREKPDDVQGWRLLGQVNMAIGRMEDSIAAFEKALDLEPKNIDIREKYAQALMATGTEESLQNSKRQVEYLLSLAPDNRDYRLLLTVVATQLGDSELAFNNFMMIRNELSSNSSFYQSLVIELINIGISPERLGADAVALQARQARQSTAGDSTGGASGANAAATESQGASKGIDKGISKGIEVTISLAPELVSKLPENGFLIVFAQNAKGDSRIPLAVSRLPLSDFPITISLSDENAMMPSMTLSSADVVRVTARISRDADVMPSSGELQGQIEQLELLAGQNMPIDIVINKELE